MKPTILTFVAYYLPGYKSGGPVRTIANMVEHLGDEFDFRIVSKDRDSFDKEPYPGVQVDAWNAVGKAQVFYASPRIMRLRGVAGLLRDTPHDVLYLNSFFAYGFTTLPLLARRLGVAPKKPCVIAPRGEFSAGALALKKWKKRPYLMLARALSLYSGLIWQASSPHEKKDIRREFAAQARQIIVAPDLPPLVAGHGKNNSSSAVPCQGPLRVLFLSRITPMKNLDFALRVLSRVKVSLIFDIYGPIRDQAYWRECQRLIADLPENIAVEYRGSITPDEVSQEMAAYDLFFLPTLGENYGHVIPEALSAGTPVLVSDTTPWRDLAKHEVGWDVPLRAGEKAFAEHIEKVAHMSTDQRDQWRQHVAKWTAQMLADPAAVEANRRLFLSAVRD